MKTIEINLFKFKELSKESQQKAIEDHYNINIDYEWWGFVYEDAENIGLKLDGFDVYHGNCEGEFILSAHEVASNIIMDHGENCDTYKTAQNFINEHDPVFCEYMDEKSEKYDSHELEEDLLYIENEFLKSLLEDYLIILKNEYEFITS